MKKFERNYFYNTPFLDNVLEVWIRVKVILVKIVSIWVEVIKVMDSWKLVIVKLVINKVVRVITTKKVHVVRIIIIKLINFENNLIIVIIIEPQIGIVWNPENLVWFSIIMEVVVDTLTIVRENVQLEI